LPHLDDAYGLARWLTGNAADAEDVTQEACIRALAAIERAQTFNARAWFMTIVRNSAYTWITRNRPREFVTAPDADIDVADDAPSVEAGLIARADGAALERALEGLPLVFRETIVMREFSELSYREIADVTGAPVGTVMSRLARARALLATALKEQEA
jgi:RNA polymerase sigma-70 factor (ECF subfamily)